MQRFIRERKTSYLRNVIISVLIFLLIFAGFGCGLTAMNKKMDQEEMQTLQNAITRSVTTCYTLGRELSAESWLPEKTLRTSL